MTASTVVGQSAPPLMLRGAGLAMVYAVVGAVCWAVLDVVTLTVATIGTDQSQGTASDFGFLIFYIGLVVLFGGLFALPFAAVGGALLGWFLETTKWAQRSRSKSILASAVMAGLAALPMLAAGLTMVDCARSHGQCEVDFARYANEPVEFFVDVTQGVAWSLDNWNDEPKVRGWFTRVVLAGFITLACGAAVGWRLAVPPGKGSAKADKPLPSRPGG